jgi:hypothetical protein
MITMSKQSPILCELRYQIQLHYVGCCPLFCAVVTCQGTVWLSVNKKDTDEHGATTLSYQIIDGPQMFINNTNEDM